MNEYILKTLSVELLEQYVGNAKLLRFISVLPKYKIKTLHDVITAEYAITNSIPGFGETKWKLLEELRDVLNNNIDKIISEYNLVASNIKDVVEDTQNPAASMNIFNDVPQGVMLIPLDWLIESGRVDMRFASVISNTLKGKNIGDILTLDISELSQYRGVGTRKQELVIQLKGIIQSIVEEQEDIEAQYIASKSIPVLPSIGNKGESYSSLIKRFIDEVATRYEVYEKKDCADIIRLAYQYGYDIKSIAVNKNKTRARIEQLLTERNPIYKSFSWTLHNNLNASDKCDMLLYEVSNEFRTAIQNIQDFCSKTPTKESLAKFLGDGTDDNVVNFILHFIGAKIFGGDMGYNTRIKDQFIVVDCDLKHLNNKWGVVFTLLGHCVKPLKKENLIIELRKKFSPLSKQVEDIIINIVENSSQFEVERTDLITAYSLKWQELPSMQSRLERILFENKTSLQKSDLENEYNRRLRECGMEDPDVFHIRTSKNIHQLHRGGTWIWKEYTTEKKTISREKLIRQYVAQKQKIRIEDIMEFLREIIPDIKEQSVKTILTKYCISTTEGYYIDRDSKADYRDLHIATSEDITLSLINIMDKAKEYTYQDIYEIYRDKYKIAIPESKIRTTCENPDVFTIIRGENRRVSNKVKINPLWDGTYEVRNRTRGVVAEWKRNVREEIINKLRYSPNYEMDRYELCKHLDSFIPKDISKTGIYKIFDDENTFVVKAKEGGVGKIIALNIDKWEAELKQHLANQDNCASTYNYDSKDRHLQDVQHKHLSNLRYNLSTKTDEDLNNLYVSTMSLISYNLQQLVNDYMEISDIKSVWSFMVEQMNIIGGGVDSAYYRMLNKLYAYMFGATSRDDRYYLWVELRLNYEPYLKKLLSERGYSIIKTDGKDMQLKDLINLCQTMNVLPKKDNICHITQCVSNVLNKRNYRGHNAEVTPNDTIIVQNIQKAITLYLYTSMQIKNLI